MLLCVRDAIKLFLFCALINIAKGRGPDEGVTEDDWNIVDKLSSLQFKNSGTVKSTDRFVWKEQPELYLEPENVTTVRHGWQVWKSFRYLYKQLVNGTLVAPPVGMRSSVPLGGLSTGFVELRGDGSFHEWTIMNQTPGGAAKIQIFDDAFLAVSWKVTSETSSDNLIFHPRKTKHHTLDDFIVDNLMESLLNQESKSKTSLSEGVLALRTHPSENMKSAKIQGVQALEYSGAYPVTKLRVNDDRLPFNLTVFAFSTYSVNDMEFSATPAVQFVPVVENPSKSNIQVKLHLVLPRGMEPRTQRLVPAEPSSSSNLKENFKTVKAFTDLDCFHLCNVKYQSYCKSWSFDATGLACLIFNTVNLNSFSDTASSGLKSSWAADNEGGVECLSYVTPGDAPPSGNMSICTPIGTNAVLSAFDNLSEWNTSSQANALKHSLKSVSSKVSVYGALATGSHEVQAGKKDVLNSVFLSWFYPNKDFMRRIYGNMYTELFKNSLSVANFSLSSTQKALDDITTLNDVFYNSSLPVFLQDMLLNSISHIRSAMWFKDSRWRQWEAFDCSNIDSVHNDGERHIPYIMFLPEAVKSKIQGWAKSQLANGMIVEQLHEGCNSIYGGGLDTPGGRIMSDVSSMFIVYLLEMYKWGNEVQMAKDMWPVAKKAAQWHLNQANKTGSLQNMDTTYDVLGLVAYTYSAYSTSFHLLAMRTAEEYAIIMGETDFATECRTAYERGQNLFDTVQWNNTAGYYNAYTQVGKAENIFRRYEPRLRKNIIIDPNSSPPGALMTDTFYSQVLAYSVGLGLLPKDVDKLKSHMKAEYRINNTPYGMLVVTRRHKYPGPFQDNAVWQMGNPNWASINIHLGEDVDNALKVAETTLEAWRSKVNDIWNVAGISGGLGYGVEGQPYITSHYGYFMSSWHLIMALTGQQANLPEKTLTFAPKLSAPYRYPVLLAGTVGVLEATTTEYSVCIKIGRPVALKTILVGTSVCPSVPLSLGPGDCVTWKF